MLGMRFSRSVSSTAAVAVAGDALSSAAGAGAGGVGKQAPVFTVPKRGGGGGGGGGGGNSLASVNSNTRQTPRRKHLVDSNNNNTGIPHSQLQQQQLSSSKTLVNSSISTNTTTIAIHEDYDTLKLLPLTPLHPWLSPASLANPAVNPIILLQNLLALPDKFHANIVTVFRACLKRLQEGEGDWIDKVLSQRELALVLDSMRHVANQPDFTLSELLADTTTVLTRLKQQNLGCSTEMQLALINLLGLDPKNASSCIRFVVAAAASTATAADVDTSVSPIEVYYTLVSQLLAVLSQDAQHTALVEAIYNRIQKLSSTTTSTTTSPLLTLPMFCSVIYSFALSGNFEKAEAVVKDAKRLFPYDKSAPLTLLMAYARTGKMIQASKMFDFIIKNNEEVVEKKDTNDGRDTAQLPTILNLSSSLLHPYMYPKLTKDQINLITWNALITTMANKHRFGELDALLATYSKRDGFEMLPSTIASIIECYSASAGLSKALAFYFEQADAGVIHGEPKSGLGMNDTRIVSMEIVSALISAYLRHGDVLCAWRLVAKYDGTIIEHGHVDLNVLARLAHKHANCHADYLIDMLRFSSVIPLLFSSTSSTATTSKFDVDAIFSKLDKIVAAMMHSLTLTKSPLEALTLAQHFKTITEKLKLPSSSPSNCGVLVETIAALSSLGKEADAAAEYANLVKLTTRGDQVGVALSWLMSCTSSSEAAIQRLEEWRKWLASASRRGSVDEEKVQELAIIAAVTTTEASHRFYESFHRVIATEKNNNNYSDLELDVVGEWTELGLCPRASDVEMRRALGTASVKIDTILEKLSSLSLLVKDTPLKETRKNE